MTGGGRPPDKDLYQALLPLLRFSYFFLLGGGGGGPDRRLVPLLCYVQCISGLRYTLLWWVVLRLNILAVVGCVFRFVSIFHHMKSKHLFIFVII